MKTRTKKVWMTKTNGNRVDVRVVLLAPMQIVVVSWVFSVWSYWHFCVVLLCYCALLVIPVCDVMANWNVEHSVGYEPTESES